MCPHEIKAKKGFHPELFQPRHFRRDCISGSLHGWVPSEDQVDNILGYEVEWFTEDNQDNTTDVSILLTQDFEETADVVTGVSGDLVTEGSADVRMTPIPQGETIEIKRT